MKTPDLETLLKIIAVQISKGDNCKEERHRALPREFSGTRVNNIAITQDYTKFAYKAEDGYWHVQEMPKSGKIEIDGYSIHFGKNTGIKVTSSKGASCNVNINSNSNRIVSSVSNIAINGGKGISVSQGGGSSKTIDVDDSYDSVNKVRIRGNSSNIELGLSKDDKVYILGKTSSEPEQSGDRLTVYGLDGRIELPKSNQDLGLDINAPTGEVSGDIAHKGRIKTATGEINLDLYANLAVTAKTQTGEVDIEGMTAKGRNEYHPPKAKPTGTLELVAATGDIRVKYCL